MIQVAIAITTIRANRIVYAEGRVNRDLGGSASSVPGGAGATGFSTSDVGSSLDMNISFRGNGGYNGARGGVAGRHGRRLAGRDVLHAEAGEGVDEGDQWVEEVEEGVREVLHRRDSE